MLYEFLYFHLKPCIYRLKNNIMITEVDYLEFLDDVDDEKLLEIVKRNIKEIEKVYNVKFNKQELVLITFHFKSSIEREMYKFKKTVILVCGLGYGTSRILAKKLTRNFQINIVDILPAYKLKEKIEKFDNIDFVISTIDLEINSIKITPLLSIEDQKLLISKGIKRKINKININNLLLEIEKISPLKNKEKIIENILEKYGEIFYAKKIKEYSIFNYMNSNNVIYINDVDNWEDAIFNVGKILLKNKSITYEYIDEIIKISKKYGPYIFLGNNLAIPHGTLKYTIKNDVSFLILKKEVEFIEKKARLFICFSSIDSQFNKDILNSILEIINQKELIDSIIETNNYEELKKIIKKEFNHEIIR
ncbi:PTS sugar transporter subunit IIA [Oceanivirga salmonicida]|uniref:PTS sugar transporter subunit IIA n=1 Tax=Oceanivirga salmonicida TaxID=1769291 RepID=UPI0027D25606|nr:PTS sugar transporter subunit IIA [Oceanivirga salmonicida]